MQLHIRTFNNHQMFNIPKCISVSTYRVIASTRKISAFEYENKASRESNNHTKRLNWSLFKEAPCRWPKPVNNLQKFVISQAKSAFKCKVLNMR